jgi:hypothetical protein
MARAEFSWCVRLLDLDCGSVSNGIGSGEGTQATAAKGKLGYSADTDFDAVFGGLDWLESPAFSLQSA